MKSLRKWSNMNLTDRIHYYKKCNKNSNVVIFIVIFTLIIVLALITSLFPSLRIKEFEDYKTYIENNFVMLLVIASIVLSVISYIKFFKLKNKEQKSYYSDDYFLSFLSTKNIECDYTDKDIFDDATFYEDESYILKSNDIKKFISKNLTLFHRYNVTKSFVKDFLIIIAILVAYPFVISLPHEGLGVVLYLFIYFQLFSIVIIGLLIIFFILLFVSERLLGYIEKAFLDEVDNKIDKKKIDKYFIKDIFEYYKLLY